MQSAFWYEEPHPGTLLPAIFVLGGAPTAHVNAATEAAQNRLGEQAFWWWFCGVVLEVGTQDASPGHGAAIAEVGRASTPTRGYATFTPL